MTSDRLVTLWRKLCCKFGNHRYFIIGRCGIATDHVGCRDCGRQWGMNHDVRGFLPWSEVSGFHIAHGYDPVAALRARSSQERGRP
jgi:hypothetical protein